MALTAVNVANLALGRLGATAIVAFTDTDAEGVQCALHYEPTRDALLRSHSWQFASLWVELVLDEEADSGTSTDDTNTSTKLYDTDQEWEDDEFNDYYLWITGGTGVNQIRLIEDTAETYITVATAFTTTPDDTSTYEVWENYPPYPWDYQYDLPSDLLRLNRTYSAGIRYEINNGLLKTNESALAINYVKTVTDPSDFDTLFVEVLVAMLAAKLCMPLLHDKVWTDRLQAEAARAIARARTVNLAESKTKSKESTWNEARSL